MELTTALAAGHHGRRVKSKTVPTLLGTLQVVFCDTVAAFDPTRSVLEIKTLLSKTRSTFRDGQNCC